ncbi:MAG: class I SAM-dependent methyltransferase [Abitibacteriaceae bacterium]|nr:class I SAM-dependent methyltransferase [Abditibacteriaceae bacterium]
MKKMESNQEAHWQPRRVPCGICRSKRFRVLGYRGGRAHHSGKGITSRVVKCRDCGFIYPNPMPFPRDLSHYADADVYFRAHDVQGKIDYARKLLQEATEILDGQKGKLLDIGCGRGESLVAARDLGWQAEGVEPSEDFVAYGRENFEVEVHQGLIENINYPDASFDVVFLSAVLEHVYNPLELLIECRRLLRPGGLLFLDVPNEAGLFFTMGRLYHRLRGRAWTLNLSPTFEPYHVAGFSPHTLDVAFEKTQFEVVTLRTYGAKLASPSKLMALARGVEKISRLTHSGSFLEAWARAV